MKKIIPKGKGELKTFMNRNNINNEYNLGFKLIEISEELLTKILCKKYKEYEKSSADFESYLINQSEGNKEASILIRSVKDLDDYERETNFHYIYAIYIRDLKI